VSHQLRNEPGACHATMRLASVSKVSGTVVTTTQNLRPVSSRRAALAFQCRPELSEELNHLGTVIRSS